MQRQLPSKATLLVGFFALAVASVTAACQSPAPTPTTAAAPEPPKVETQQRAATLAGFSDVIAFSGRSNPIAVRFASNGKVFVAEEAGKIYFYDNMSDTTATLFVDLSAEVNSYWDRGMLGFALDPNYATNGFMYVIYNHDTATNAENNQSVANRNGTDGCPSTPGGTSQGCVTYGRITRFKDPGMGYPISITGPNRFDLVTEWPQQFPSHAIGGLAFGPDGQLYATAGDGASFGAQDWGNFGIPKNPLGDPPAGVGGTMTSPTSRGGSLRSQSFRRPSGENVVLNGTVIRIDPATGLASSGNPNAGHADVDGKRIIALGLRNPYRFTFHPTTGDIWIADVGGNAWEEIDRLPAPLTGTPMKNFGWPCFEGAPSSSNWSGFNLCSSGFTHTTPFYAYAHDAPIISGDTCSPTGSSAITGIAFYPPTGAGNYPSSYRGAMFFADLPRNCIWYMTADANGLPVVSTRKNFIVNASHPVDLQIGPNNDLFYVDYGGTGGTGTNNGTGTVRRVRYQAPVAVATANPTSGFTPLAVQFNGAGSTPGQTGLTLSYAWDLDGDGQYDDSTAQNPSRTYTSPGTINVRLRVTDTTGSNESQPITITAGSTTTPPQPTMDTPLASLTWKVGDQITFSGSATDVEDGTIPASGLTWTLVVQHCPNSCHEHVIQSYPGVASGSFPAPDHEYPSYLQLRLTATDSHGVSTTIGRDLQPQTVTITLNTVPAASPGLDVGLNLETFVAPVTRTVIKGSGNTIIVNNQTRGNTLYTFSSWSDGGGQAHNVTADTDLSVTANFTTSVTPWVSADVGAVATAGSWSESGGVHTINGNGADIWTAADEFRYTYQQLTGDGSITARVVTFPNSANNANGKAGVMMRQNLTAGSPHVMAALPPQGTATLVKQVKRVTAGATSTSETGATPAFPSYVRVVRSGTSFTSFYSTNGTTFTQVGAATTIGTMTGTIYVGLAVTSHVDGTNSTVTFDNVTLTTPTPPAAPSGLVASGGINQATLNWTDASNNESGFKIERKLASDPDTSFAQVGSAAANASSFTNTSVPAGSYTYRVKATNANGDSPPSNTATATVTAPTPPNAPSLLTANGGVSQAVLQWSDNASDETGFKIERKLQADPDTSFAQIATVGANVTTYTNTGVAGGVYSYRVRATNTVGDSGYSNTTDVTVTNPPPPSAPSGLVGSGGVAQVALTWTDNANNETGFRIERKLSSDPDTSFASVGTAGVNATSFTNTGVPGGVYTYRVFATNGSGDSGASNTADATVTDPTVPADPSGLIATGGQGQASLTWTDNASDETSYKVERKLTSDPDTSFAQIASLAANATSYVNGSLAAGDYSYRVRAANGVGNSGYSNVATATVTTPPVNPWTSADVGAVAAAGSWSENAGVHTIAGNGADIWTAADEFRFTYQQLTGDGSITARITAFSNVGNANGKAGVMMRQNLTAGSPHVMTALPPGGTATLVKLIKRLTASVAATAESGSSSTLPGWIRLTRTGTSFTASYSTNGTTFTQVGTATTIGTMTGTIYVGLAVTSHVDGTNATAVFDNVTIVGPPPPTAPNPPGSLTATGGTGQVGLTWLDNASNETGFKVERKLSTDPDSSYAQIATPAANATSYTNTGLAAGTYSFRVRATNGVGDSAYSNVATATAAVATGPAAPSNLNATTATGNSAILTWTDNASNETGFRVERNTGAGFVSLATKAANTTTHTDSALAPGTYTYRVIATGSSDSAASNTVVVVINNTVADAYVREGTNGGTNYGSETFVKVKLNSTVANNRRGYVRFSIAGVAATVTSAKVRLYGVATTTAKATGIHAVSNTTWGETTITFNNAPAMTSPAIQTINVGTTAGYVEWDVTSYVQAQRTAGASAISLGLLTTTLAPDAETNFNSKENAANKPILIISSK